MNLRWTKKKPKLNKECILIVAQWMHYHKPFHWEYTLYTVERVDGYDDNDNPIYYFGLLCANRDEWGDIDDLKADKYCVLPLLKLLTNPTGLIK